MTQTEVTKTTSMVSRSDRRPAEVGRGQPSVLHLLPFSNNEAGEDTSLVTLPDVQKSASSEPRVFPVLAVTRIPHVHSKCQSFAPDTSINFKDKNRSSDQRRRSTRAVSERLSGGQVRKNGDIISRPRAKSEYDLYLDRQPSTATFYMNEDANFKTDENSPALASPLEKEQIIKKSTLRRRYVFNSLMKISDLQKQGHVISFWYKKKIDEAEARDKTQGADSSLTPSFPSNRSFKLNVRELPRSKTPIVDNDPDKLNMNTVIAFLQTTDIDVRANDKRIDSKNSAVRIVQKQIDYDQVSARPKRQAVQENLTPHTAETSRQPTEVDTINQGRDNQGNNETVHHRFPDFRPQSYPSYRMDKIKKNAVDRKQDGANHRTRNSQYSDLKTYNSIVSTQSEPKKRPNSLHWRVSTDQQEVVDISTMISNINNDTCINNNTTRPFRLHRFLTIVPDRLPDVETTKSAAVEDAVSSITRGTWVKCRNVGSPKSKSAGRVDHFSVNLENQDTHSSLQVNRSTQEASRLTTAVHMMAVKKGFKSHGTQHGTPDDLTRSRKTTVICLPSADYETDEDVVPSREITRVSLKEQTQTQIYTQNDDPRPKSSFTDTGDNKNNHKKDTEHCEIQISGSSPSINPEIVLKPDTEKDLTPYQIDDLVAQPAAGHYPRQDFSIPSSYFLSYTTTGVSVHSPCDNISSSLDSFNDHKRQNSHVLPSHQFLKTSSNIPQTFAKNQVKLTLRKERDKASSLTYMSDMEVL